MKKENKKSKQVFGKVLLHLFSIWKHWQIEKMQHSHYFQNETSIKFLLPRFPSLPPWLWSSLNRSFSKKIPFYFKPRKEKIPWKSWNTADLYFSFVCNSFDEPMGVMIQKYNKIPAWTQDVSCRYEWFSSTRFWNAFRPSHFHHHTVHNSMHAPYHQYFPL